MIDRSATLHSAKRAAFALDPFGRRLPRVHVVLRASTAHGIPFDRTPLERTAAPSLILSASS
jgi:hypothetical protein